MWQEMTKPNWIRDSSNASTHYASASPRGGRRAGYCAPQRDPPIALDAIAGVAAAARCRLDVGFTRPRACWLRAARARCRGAPGRCSMNRDHHGASVSLWMATADAPALPPLSDIPDAQVCIVGAGIAGLTTAYYLAREGRSV